MTLGDVSDFKHRYIQVCILFNTLQHQWTKCKNRQATPAGGQSHSKRWEATLCRSDGCNPTRSNPIPTLVTALSTSDPILVTSSNPSTPAISDRSNPKSMRPARRGSTERERLNSTQSIAQVLVVRLYSRMCLETNCQCGTIVISMSCRGTI
jgi:hypothetical protein